MLNVHAFDGKLKGLFAPKKEHTVQEKEILFSKLITEVSPIAKRTVQTMISDMRAPQGGSNYHSANDIDASNILADILSRDYTDILSLLDEQLVDTQNLGMCDSGRVTRLLQIWLGMDHSSD